MVELIKYCLYCFGIFISASFGNNPSGLSFETVLVGIVTCLVLVGILLLLLYFVGLIVNKYK